MKSYKESENIQSLIPSIKNVHSLPISKIKGVTNKNYETILSGFIDYSSKIQIPQQQQLEKQVKQIPPILLFKNSSKNQEPQINTHDQNNLKRKIVSDREYDDKQTCRKLSLNRKKQENHKIGQIKTQIKKKSQKSDAKTSDQKNIKLDSPKSTTTQPKKKSFQKQSQLFFQQQKKWRKKSQFRKNPIVYKSQQIQYYNGSHDDTYAKYLYDRPQTIQEQIDKYFQQNFKTDYPTSPSSASNCQTPPCQNILQDLNESIQIKQPTNHRNILMVIILSIILIILQLIK